MPEYLGSNTSVLWIKGVQTFLSGVGLIAMPELFTTATPLPPIQALFSVLGLALDPASDIVFKFYRIIGILAGCIGIFAIIGALASSKGIVVGFSKCSLFGLQSLLICWRIVVAQFFFIVCAVGLKYAGNLANDAVLIFAGSDVVYMLFMTFFLITTKPPKPLAGAKKTE
jgi:hypothetical protein